MGTPPTARLDLRAGGVGLRPAARGPRALVAAVVALLLAACVAQLVSSYDKDSIDRATEISKSVLTLYQDLLALAPAERTAAVNGTLGKRQGDIETQIRLHLLREQGRPMNDEGVKVATDMLQSWQTFSTSHRTGDETALTDATLNVERGIMERHLRAAFVAEEAKKPSNDSGK